MELMLIFKVSYLTEKRKISWIFKNITRNIYLFCHIEIVQFMHWSLKRTGKTTAVSNAKTNWKILAFSQVCKINFRFGTNL